MSKMIGKEEAIVFGMGFATNSLNIPSLVDEVSNSTLPTRCFQSLHDMLRVELVLKRAVKSKFNFHFITPDVFC